MSAWKKPSRNTCLKNTSAALARITSGSKPAAISAARSSEAMPLTRSRVSTRRAVRSPVDPRHAKAFVLGAVLGELRGRRRLEPQVHLQPGRGRDGLHHLDRPEPAQLPAAAARPRPRSRRRSRGRASIAASMPGRSTLTATSLALAGHGEMHLRDRGRGDRPVVEAREQLLDRPAQLGLDHAARHGRIGRAAADPAAATDRRRGARRADRPRVARLWPSLMKLGPSSCSARASRSPGRPGASLRATRRAIRTTNSGTGASSSGNRALWRARQRAIRTRRQRLRIARSMAAQRRQAECSAAMPPDRLR